MNKIKLGQNSKMLINQVFIKYQKEYNLQLPKIEKIVIIKTDDFWARFLSEDLYKRKYILYISSDLFDFNNKFVSQILYHEFTHLTDSLNFLHLDKQDFETIMISYSEFNAASIEMSKRINQIESNDISLQSEIIYGDGILTVESFMAQSFDKVVQDFELMSNNKNSKNLYYDTNHMYYFIGYKSALEKYNLIYHENIPSIDDSFITIYQSINNCLKNGIDNYYEIIKYQNNFEQLVKDIYKRNLRASLYDFL